MHILDGKHLRNVFPSIVDDYNNRPHVSLDGLTPNEAEQNFTLDKQQLSTHIVQATSKRKVYNRSHHCDHCR